MEALNEYWLPYIISNAVFALSVLAAWKKPMFARIFLVIVFLWASGVNTMTALKTPEVYLEYGKMASLETYRDFIYGFFSGHITTMVLAIAACQFMIALGLMLRKVWTHLACIGGILFGLGIAPLGVGSAFPCTIMMSLALFVLLMKYEHSFIWNLHQYGIKANPES